MNINEARRHVPSHTHSVTIHSRSVGEFQDEYFFSTDHCQGVGNQGWSVTTHYLPSSVVPRPSLPSGRITTLEELLLIFYPKDRCKEVPNPDPAYQPSEEDRLHRLFR